MYIQNTFIVATQAIVGVVVVVGNATDGQLPQFTCILSASVVAAAAARVLLLLPDARATVVFALSGL